VTGKPLSGVYQKISARRRQNRCSLYGNSFMQRSVSCIPQLLHTKDMEYVLKVGPTKLAINCSSYREEMKFAFFFNVLASIYFSITG
jgi:hypothetical protein